MKKLQVLVATMKQEDFSLVEKMNIKCDAVIANQHNTDSIASERTEFGEIKMITTSTRGVGLNRNIALCAADAEILLFADDDMTYYDGTLEGVKKAFEEIPNADVIIFGIDFEKNGEIIEKRHLKVKRRYIWNALKYGAAAVGIRKKACNEAELKFSEFFGGGCIYGSGEDSLFIISALKNGLRVYTHDYVLGRCKKDSSTWFKGFNEKYFFDKGAFFNYAFNKWKIIVIPVFAFKMMLRKKTCLSFINMIKMMNCGAKASEKYVSYEEFVSGN